MKRLSAFFLALALCFSVCVATACSVFDKNVSSESKESDSVGGGNSSSETIDPGEEESKKTVWNKVANFSTGFSSALRK